MADSQCALEAVFGKAEYRVVFGERKCVKSVFSFPPEIQQFGRALDRADELMDAEWFLTEEEDGKRNLVYGRVNRKINRMIVSIDVDKNVDVLSSPLFSQRIKHGHRLSVKIKGLDNLEDRTPGDIARGGFWCVFSPIE